MTPDVSVCLKIRQFGVFAGDWDLNSSCGTACIGNGGGLFIAEAWKAAGFSLEEKE